MKKYFNTEGLCRPKKHYMVNLEDRLDQIKTILIDREKYFVINRGRQYGKTTTLAALEDYLQEEYIVISLDFQLMGTEDFTDEETFSRAFIEDISAAVKKLKSDNIEKIIAPIQKLITDSANFGLKELFVGLSSVCENSPRPIVLMIDEVDSASNNQVFIDFLAQLRGYYLKRDKVPIFHSVILAGVYNIKNLKLKLRPESEHQYNSPWNIAADFDIEMRFTVEQIMEMLLEYEADKQTGMNIQAVSEEIYQYTSGYPVLVSLICKYIDEEIYDKTHVQIPKCDFPNILENNSFNTFAWSKSGVETAVNKILIKNIALFESMIRHLNEFPTMKQMFHAILFQGSDFAYNPDTKEINLACMFGYAVNSNGKVQIANRIFETRLYNYFLSEEELSSAIGNMAKRDKSYFIHNGRLDMDTALKKFVEYFTEIYGDNDIKFVETYGRKFFLLFLKPIINGTGNYYIEAQTRDARRTDVIVDYLGEQFIIELKIWYGNEYNERGEAQLADYLDYYHKEKGYLLSFNFNKNKKIGVKELTIGNKTILEAVV